MEVMSALEETLPGVPLSTQRSLISWLSWGSEQGLGKELERERMEKLGPGSRSAAQGTRLTAGGKVSSEL